MSNQQMMNKEQQNMENQQQSKPVRRYSPMVDIYETDQQLTLQAELPGVSEQDLRIEVERGVLTLEAEQAASEANVHKVWYRQFKLSDRIDADAGEAGLKDGILTLNLPKREEAQPKKITVKTLH